MGCHDSDVMSSDLFKPSADELDAREREKYNAAHAAAIVKEKHELMATDDEPRVYAVTSLGYKWHDSRTPVVCDSLESADKYVMANDLDLFENSYLFVVVEANKLNYPYGLGIGVPEINGYWYRWNFDKESYEPIEKPKEYESTICFGIG